MDGVTYLAVDLETTGLDLPADQIMEIAWAPLDAQFQKVAPTQSLTLEVTPAVRERILGNNFVRDMHTANGLTKDALEGGLPLAMVEKIIMNAADKWDWAGSKLIVFGSSVHFDLRFLQAHMPTLAKWLHYRAQDVTTMVAFAAAAGVPPEERRTVAHRAAADIDWSIETAQRLLGALRVQQGVYV